MAIAIIILLAISILSLGLCYRLHNDNRSLTNALVNNKQIIIQPMGVAREFSFIGERGDARYLRAIGASLVNFRLNVTNSNIQASHDFLLAYACEGQEKILKPVLADERLRVKDKEASSVFYIGQILVDPDTGLVDITGKLEFTYGINTPSKPVPKHYQLRIDTRNEGMCFNSFVEVPANAQ